MEIKILTKLGGKKEEFNSINQRTVCKEVKFVNLLLFQKRKMKDILVQKAEKHDATQIAEFQILMAKETEGIDLVTNIVSMGVLAVFEQPEKGCYFVAKSGRDILASLLITYEWSDWRNGWVWWIQSVYVKPEFRKKKIFKKMFTFLKESVLKQSNARGLRLYVDKRNEHACKIYEALGMNGSHYHLYEWRID